MSRAPVLPILEVLVISRRHFVGKISAASAALAVHPKLFAAPVSRQAETYRNPILGGDHPDGSPIRVGSDFYLTHSSFDYAPGLLIWHSRDLVNWKPVVAALHNYRGSVYAPYLCEYERRFYIYYPDAFRIMVVHADSPEGPWSEPVDLGINAIDPAHIAQNGRRFLYLAGGLMAELTADGLAVKTPARAVINPWPIPPTTRIECICLEGPKLLEHNGYFYLNMAEGGTSGPTTSHAVISARSSNATGPWEFSPFNPIVRTMSRDDHWWSLGHGRLVDTADGKWHLTVHAYENGYRTLGRQLSLLPVEWTSDGWFHVPPGILADSEIPMPVAGTRQKPPLNPSDNFTSSELGLQWSFWRGYDRSSFITGNGSLIITARGKSLKDAWILTTPIGSHSYTVEIDLMVDAGCHSGLILFYDPEHATGFGLGPEGVSVRSPTGSSTTIHKETSLQRATFRVVNDNQEVDFFYRLPDGPWKRTEQSVEVSGMHHNVLGGFLDLRPAVYASGSGKVTLQNFRYWPEANPPKPE